MSEVGEAGVFGGDTLHIYLGVRVEVVIGYMV